MRVGRKPVERHPGADANFEHAVAGPKIQAFDNLMLVNTKTRRKKKS